MYLHPFHEDLEGWTALFVAYMYGCGRCIKLLQEATKAPLIDQQGKAPIHYGMMDSEYTDFSAVERIDKLKIQFMLDRRLDPNTKSNLGIDVD